LPALQASTLPINQIDLVSGGGIGSRHAALSLADRGMPVHLVEKETHLGGYLGTQVGKCGFWRKWKQNGGRKEKGVTA